MTTTGARVLTLQSQPDRLRMRASLQELWQWRELLWAFAWRDITLRYRSTVLGIAWVVLQPMLTTALFAVIFGRLAGIPSNGLPYPVFALAGLLPWQFFAQTISQASTGLVAQGPILTKVYFPRMLVPLSSILSGILDLAVALLPLAGLLTVYRIPLTWRLVVLPGVIMLAILAAIGVSLWFSALDYRYRDIRYTIPFLMQLWFFATPIVYPSSLLPISWHVVSGLNPMASVVEGFRWAVLAGPPVPPLMLVGSILSTSGLLGSGLWFFQRVEAYLADTT